MELHEAVYRSLNEGGVGLLSSPQRFLAYVMDWVDPEDPMLAVLESNCNTEFMEIFAVSARNLTTEAMSQAVARAVTLLVDVRFIHPDIARQLTSQIAYGVCTFAGVVAPDEVRVSLVSGASSWRGSDSWDSSGGAEQSSSYVRTQGSAVYGASGDDAASSMRDRSAGSANSQQWGDASATSAGTQFNQATSDFVPGPSPAPVQPVRKRSNVGIVLAIVAAVAVLGIVAFVFLSRGGMGVDNNTEHVSTLASAKAPSAFVGTWKPASVQVEGPDEKDYKVRLRRAQEGELTLRDDGTFVRSVFPDLLEGSWKQTDGTTAELEPRTEDGMLYTWDSEDLSHPVQVTLDPDSESLSVVYADGVSATYEKDGANLSPDPFVGLWQVDELVQGGVVQFGKDVFDADRAAGWYTEYLDVRGNGTLIWDRQGDKSEGSWRMTGPAQAVFFVRDVREQGAYWCGIMERGNDNRIVFYFGGEGDKEIFSQMEKDNRSELKIPERG